MRPLVTTNWQTQIGIGQIMGGGGGGASIISLFTSPPEGVARYCFHPVCLCVCLCVCVSVCPANILIFYFSATRRDVDLKLIQDTYRIVLDLLKILTFIGQRSRSQGRYIAF